MACNVTVDNFQAVDAELDVIDKYKELMVATLSDESIYIRAKETIYSVFDELGVNNTDRASIVVGHIDKMTTELSATAMQSAIQWAKEERDGAYSLALIKAQTEVAIAQAEVAKESICKTIKETELMCANITSTIAKSIRENGMVTSYEDADECKPKTLDNSGLKYEQTQQVKAATYQTFADAYRKSGVVEIGIDSTDEVKKGLTGNEDGYTWQQQTNAERQRIAYEDSKLNHAANSSASMIGQMLTAEIAPNEADVQRWRDALDGLLTKHSTTSSL